MIIIAAPSLPSLSNQDEAHAEGRDRVRPPPAEQGVEADACQHDDRQVPARLGLFGIGGQGAAAEVSRGATLGAGHHSITTIDTLAINMPTMLASGRWLSRAAPAS